MLKQRLLICSHLQAGSYRGGIRWRILDSHCRDIFPNVQPSPLCFSTSAALALSCCAPSGTIDNPLVAATGLASSTRQRQIITSRQQIPGLAPLRLPHSRRYFHDYFTTAVSNTPNGQLSPLGTSSTPLGGHPESPTIVRIPLDRAKEHYGSLRSRGNRPYNEDWFQAGVLELPPQSLVDATTTTPTESNSSVFSPPTLALSKSVFYYAVFDGHGGDECSVFLKTKLHEYIENTAKEFYHTSPLLPEPTQLESTINAPEYSIDKLFQQSHRKQLQESLIASWRAVGGYFKRFRPNFLAPPSTSGHFQGDSRGVTKAPASGEDGSSTIPLSMGSATGDGSWESILTYAFLWADFDYITGKWRNTAERTLAVEDAKPPANTAQTNETMMVTKPKTTKVKSGSTASIALIFTPLSSNVPYWSPNATSTLLTAHIGDTRILLSNTITGRATSLTSIHHPSHPLESRRLRRYSAAVMYDSFGEERFGVLANTRSFGDASHKFLGITAEPEVTRRQLKGSDWAFMVLCSDGVSGVLSDQEIVDIVKESKTPEEGARHVVKFAEEVASRSEGGDNSTCMVVRLGGWEDRDKGGEGSKGTRDLREWKRASQEPSRRR